MSSERELSIPEKVVVYLSKMDNAGDPLCLQTCRLVKALMESYSKSPFYNPEEVETFRNAAIKAAMRLGVAARLAGVPGEELIGVDPGEINIEEVASNMIAVATGATSDDSTILNWPEYELFNAGYGDQALIGVMAAAFANGFLDSRSIDEVIDTVA
jgi:hypothetical protein